MLKKAYYFLVALIVIVSCNDDESSPELKLPSGLAFTVEVDEKGTGEVKVSASAKDANFYNVYFGDGANEKPVNANDGKATHKYAKSGTYTVTVQAHTTSTAFIAETKQVAVEVLPQDGYTTPLTYEGMKLVWQDEFEGTSLNSSYWTHEIGKGTNGWGNNELQYYRPENTSVKDGYLTITAKKENFEGSAYTSSRIITHDKKVFQYGRVDIRAKLPKGKGIWPALWMLGNNFRTVEWPACGEIDIMELVGGGAGKDNTVHGTLHWDNNGEYASFGKEHSLTSGIFADEFHVFSIVWNDQSVTWYVDDVQFNVIDITPADLSEFKNEFFFIFNVAVGGNWPGSPDGSTTFPQQMTVDYIRVFQPE